MQIVSPVLRSITVSVAFLQSKQVSILLRFDGFFFFLLGVSLLLLLLLVDGLICYPTNCIYRGWRRMRIE